MMAAAAVMATFVAGVMLWRAGEGGRYAIMEMGCCHVTQAAPLASRGAVWKRLDPAASAL